MKTEDELETRLRRALTTVANATDARDRWDEVAERITGGTVVGLVPARPARRFPARPLLVAAAVLVVLAAAVVVTAQGVDEGAVSTRPSPETGGATPEPSPGTGWLIPDPLPPGFELVSVSTDFMNIEQNCPCFARSWTRFVGRSGVADLVVAEGAGSSGVPENAESVELGEGVRGELGDLAFVFGDVEVVYGRVLAWQQDGVFVAVAARGVDDEELMRFGRSWVAQRSTKEPAAVEPDLPDGFSPGPLPDWSIPGGARSFLVAEVTLRHEPSGRQLFYQLYPRDLGMAWWAAGVPQSPFAVATYGSLRGLVIEECEQCSDEQVLDPPAYLLYGANSDVVAGTADDRDVDATRAEVERVLSTLREVDAATWRAFTRTAAEPASPETQREIDAPSIDDPSIYRFDP